MRYTILMSVDSSLGRFECESLSDQTLMEVLISGMDEDEETSAGRIQKVALRVRARTYKNAR